MKRALLLLAAVLTCAGGCASTRFASVAIENAGLGLRIESIRASGVWRPSFDGHGLDVQVWAIRDDTDYRQDLELELDGAARVCAALAADERVLDWAYIDVHFANWYQSASRKPRSVAGIAEVIVKRETLIVLRNRHAPPSEYPQYWIFVSGYKDQPDSQVPLTWEGDWR